MGKWKGNIDIKEEWSILETIGELDTNTVKRTEQLEPLINKLKSNYLYLGNDEYKDIVDILATVATFTQFNILWNTLYNWADKNQVWISTF